MTQVISLHSHNFLVIKCLHFSLQKLVVCHMKKIREIGIGIQNYFEKLENNIEKFRNEYSVKSAMHFLFWWEYITTESWDTNKLIRWKIHINYLEVKDNDKTGPKSTVALLFTEKLYGKPHGVSKQEYLYSLYSQFHLENYTSFWRLKESCTCGSVSWYCHCSQQATGLLLTVQGQRLLVLLCTDMSRPAWPGSFCSSDLQKKHFSNNETVVWVLLASA